MEVDARCRPVAFDTDAGGCNLLGRLKERCLISGGFIFSVTLHSTQLQGDVGKQIYLTDKQQVSGNAAKSYLGHHALDIYAVERSQSVQSRHAHKKTVHMAAAIQSRDV